MACARALPLLGVLAAACAHEGAEGREWVHDLRIEGTHALSPGDIKDVLATEKTGWWPFASKKWFDRAALDIDLERIPAFYADRGFFEARVVAHEVRDRGDGSVDVIIRVDEGEPSKIDQVRIDGLPANSKQRASLEKVPRRLHLEEGKRFDYGLYVAGKTQLQDQLKDDGYAYAKTDSEASIDRDDRLAQLHYKLEPGPMVHFGDIRVEGAGNIPPHAILSRLNFKKGERYKPEDIAVSQGRLYQLGVFSSVRLQLPDEPTETADVTVAVKPGPRHSLRLGGGFALENLRNEVRTRAEWVLYNFLGGLRRLTVRVRPGYAWLPNLFDIQQRGWVSINDLTLQQPDAFGTSITVQALAGYDLGIEPGYRYQGPRTTLDAARMFLNDRILVTGSWNLQYLSFFDVDPLYLTSTQLGFGFVNPYRLGYLEQSGRFDLRDRPLSPRYGGYVQVRFEEGASAFGGDFMYLKFVPELRLYAPLGPRVVVAARSEWGWLDPSGMRDSPITRRFYLGGPSSHRGFGFGRLSPQAISAAPTTRGDKIPIGGNAQVLFSFEGRIEVTKIGDYWLAVTPFVDGGDVVPQMDQLDLGNLNWAVGTALTYDTPVGVVRLGAGVRLNRLENRFGPGGILLNPDPGDRIAYHFSIGEAF
jgi:translocation and assembly module TamA